MTDKLEEVVEDFLKDIAVTPNVTTVKKIHAREGEYRDFPDSLDSRIVDALGELGIEKLYSHQAEAVRSALGGKNVVVVTPTASGKTLCYTIPVISQILKDPESRSLYIFPTKALSQDQYHEFYEISRKLGEKIKVFTYDGDTPQSARRAIRKRPTESR